ncbi:MAG: helix-turn-helix transcriptional regulator [Clostridia bacterium]|nr:helix-turn-helix transcriptional regulator [Clostridia bacterium]
MNPIGERIFELRKSKGLSQGELADKLSISRQTVSKWENNMSAPEIEKLIMLSDIFGVSVDYIIRGERPEKESQPTVVTERIIIQENNKNIDAIKLSGVGIIIAAFLLLLVTAEAFWISSAMVLIGIILLVIKTKAELYVLWSLYVAAALFCTFATAISPLHFFYKSYYEISELSLVHLFDLLFLLVFFALVFRTYKVIKKQKSDK